MERLSSEARFKDGKDKGNAAPDDEIHLSDSLLWRLEKRSLKSVTTKYVQGPNIPRQGDPESANQLAF